MKQYDEDYLKDIFESNARKIIESN